jgi:hypothetical protein
MDARLRESFLRELMILQSAPIDQQPNKEKESVGTGQQEQQQQEVQQSLHKHREVDLLLFDESGLTGRTLSGLFVACDTNLTHVLLNDLKTPIGLQASALVRLNDVIAITYR